MASLDLTPKCAVFSARVISTRWVILAAKERNLVAIEEGGGLAGHFMPVRFIVMTLSAWEQSVQGNRCSGLQPFGESSRMSGLSPLSDTLFHDLGKL